MQCKIQNAKCKMKRRREQGSVKTGGGPGFPVIADALIHFSNIGFAATPPFRQSPHRKARRTRGVLLYHVCVGQFRLRLLFFAY